jgi:hypothetical protein
VVADIFDSHVIAGADDAVDNILPAILQHQITHRAGNSLAVHKIWHKLARKIDVSWKSAAGGVLAQATNLNVPPRNKPLVHFVQRR